MEKNINAINAGWVYSENKHPVLDLHYASFNKHDDFKIMFEDKVLYNKNEIKRLLRVGGTSKNIHNIKKVFGGVII